MQRGKNRGSTCITMSRGVQDRSMAKDIRNLPGSMPLAKTAPQGLHHWHSDGISDCLYRLTFVEHYNTLHGPVMIRPNDK